MYFCILSFFFFIHLVLFQNTCRIKKKRKENWGTKSFNYYLFNILWIFFTIESKSVKLPTEVDHRLGSPYLERTCLVLHHGHRVVVPLVLCRRIGLCIALQEQAVALRQCLRLRLMGDEQPAG